MIDLDAVHLLDVEKEADPASAPSARAAAPWNDQLSMPVLIDARTGEPWVAPTEVAATPAPPVVARRTWGADLLLVALAIVVPVLLIAVAAAVPDARVGGVVLVLGLIVCSALSTYAHARSHGPPREPS